MYLDERVNDRFDGPEGSVVFHRLPVGGGEALNRLIVEIDKIYWWRDGYIDEQIDSQSS